VTSKTILKHPLVINCEDAGFIGFYDYKYHVTFKKGYRMSGYDTHSKNFLSVQDFLNMKHRIEPCPKSCYCGFGKK
jgi:hypothetical protein